LVGLVSRETPVSVDGAHSIVGSVVSSYFDDFYHRVHLRPASINAGNVVAAQTHVIEVWNGRLADNSMISIIAPGASAGLSLAGEAPPVNYRPNQARNYTLTVYRNGAAVIDHAFGFLFSEETVTLPVKGRRLVVWAWGPNWESGVTERIEYVTDVLVAHDGSEQRIRLRANPRRRMSFEPLAWDARRARMGVTTFGWQSQIWALPVWWEQEAITTSLPSGSISVTVTDAALKSYRPDGFVVLRSGETSEAAVIASISANTLTLQQPLSSAFPVGSLIAPAWAARIDGQVKIKNDTTDTASARMQFVAESEPDHTAAEIGSFWQGAAVMDWRPDWSDRVDEEWERSLAILDALTGAVAVDDLTGLPVIRRRYTWQVSGRAAIAQWHQWVAARAGRLNALWLPTFMDDIQITQPIGAGDLSIKVRADGLSRFLGVNALRRALRIETRQVVFHRLVQGVAEVDDTTESITIDSALGQTVMTDEIVRCMWMDLVRLDADALEIFYETDSIMRLSVTFRSITQ
jgi:hypothetical protein